MKNKKMLMAAVAIFLIMAASIAAMSNKETDTETGQPALSQELTDTEETAGEAPSENLTDTEETDNNDLSEEVETDE
ncbi:MAG: hypothetical protein K2I53_06875 [Lachnospiraceae bacterium]|nr:hypothetical protein [Lachnospiraceae bacterium]